MFTVGSKVKCIEGCGQLKPGVIFTVRSRSASYVYLKEIEGGWYLSRFELVDDGRTSRTTDPVTSKGKRKVNKYEEAITQYLCVGCAATGKEIAAATGHPLNCITPRFAPLRRKGLIKDSGVKRDKQIVWVRA